MNFLMPLCLRVGSGRKGKVGIDATTATTASLLVEMKLEYIFLILPPSEPRVNSTSKYVTPTPLFGWWVSPIDCLPGFMTKKTESFIEFYWPFIFHIFFLSSTKM